MQASSSKPNFWARIKPNSNERWAVWTISVGALFSLVLPGLLSQFYWGKLGINFHDTGQVGDTIGGVAGPILNFVGLLVVYFSLREQAKSTNDQKEQFDRDQVRSENENVLGNALKLLDDLKLEVEKLFDDQLFKQISSTAISNITNNLAMAFRNDLANVSTDKRFKFRYYPSHQYVDVAIKGREDILSNIVNGYFKSVEIHFARLTILLEIFIYLVKNSKLPATIKAMLYSMLHTLIENHIEDTLGVSMIFREESKAVDILINKLKSLDKSIIEQAPLASLEVQ